jgi:hypothetical protein
MVLPNQPYFPVEPEPQVQVAAVEEEQTTLAHQQRQEEMVAPVLL